MEVFVPYLDADGLGDVTPSLEVFCQICTKAGENFRQNGAIMLNVQISFERRFATDRLGFRIHYYRPLIDAMRNFLQPAAIAAAEVHLKKRSINLSQLADSSNAEHRQLLGGFWPDSTDFADGKRPYPAGNIRRIQDDEAIRFLQIGADFR